MSEIDDILREIAERKATEQTEEAPAEVPAEAPAEAPAETPTETPAAQAAEEAVQLPAPRAPKRRKKATRVTVVETPEDAAAARTRRIAEAARRAIEEQVAIETAEIDAEIIFKATMVDGVYDSDPKKNPNAVKYNTIKYEEILSKDLAVMDSTAASLCKDNDIPILVFSVENPDNIFAAVCGEEVGTLVVK